MEWERDVQCRRYRGYNYKCRYINVGIGRFVNVGIGGFINVRI